MAAFGIAAVVLGLCLYRLMIEEHDEWLERSYRNRWVFRDVPTRRGELRDRNGELLAWDEPGFDLELCYREFRREHPVAAALHGANLVVEALGGEAPYRFDRPAELVEACGVLLGLPADLLGPDADRAAHRLGARRRLTTDEITDVRFYVTALLEALGPLDARRYALALRDAALAGRRDPVRAIAIEAANGPDGVRHDALDPARFEVRLAELQALASRLREVRPDLDLGAWLEVQRGAFREWRELEALPDEERARLQEPGFWRFAGARGVPSWGAWRAVPAVWRDELAAGYDAAVRERRLDVASAGERAALPRDEAAARAVVRRLEYDIARWIALRQERHPGFRLKPSVRRVKGTLPGAADLGSLEPLLGDVAAIWDDGGLDELEARARWLGETGLEDFVSTWPGELPDGLDRALHADAGRALLGHFLAQGRRGRGGAEAALDAVLAGAPGLRFVERDRQREQRMFSSLDVVAGQDVRLTLDLALQSVAEAALDVAPEGEERAAAVIDAGTGDVLALAARAGTFAPRWRSAAIYPGGNPYVGSVAKPFVLLEHLDARRAGRAAAADADFAACHDVYSPPPGIRPRQRLRCGHSHGEETRDPVPALGRSCNTWFYRAVEGLGPDGLLAAYGRAGWIAGRPAFQARVLGIAEGAAPAPRLRPAAWAPEMQGIGYGVEVSPLFLARAYAGLATGELPTLSLVRMTIDRPRQSLGVHLQDLEVVRLGLRHCVERGTAAEVDRLAELGVLGKTGTAEINAPGAEMRNNAWFAGFVAPARDAQLVFAFVAYGVAEGRNGGRVAARMAAAFLSLIHDDGPLAVRYLAAGGPR
jgi:cell division protein FtsI/penicillin-binding protein 2